MSENNQVPTTSQIWPLLFGAVAIGVVVLIGYAALQETPEDTPADINQPQNDKPNPGEANNSSDKPDKNKPNIVSCFVTRRGEVPYQKVVRYNKIALPFAHVPGVKDISEALELSGKKIPRIVYRVDQETESYVNNLGLKTRSMVSYKAYLNGNDGQVIAYDIASTDGGIPQRLLGRLNKRGVQVDILRGGKVVDRNEITFPRNTSILPIEMEFVHDWFQAHKDYKKPVQWLFFVPEVFGFIRLIVYPPQFQTLSHQGSMRRCARYELVVTSTKAQEGIFSRQRMWFDLTNRALLRRVDLEPGSKATEEVMAERVTPNDLQELQPQIVRAPQLPQKPFPYLLEKTYYYSITSRDQKLGRVSFRFTKQAADENGPEGYLATSHVRLETGSGYRKERAVTRFDKHFHPIHYLVDGEEAADVKSNFKIETHFNETGVSLHLTRTLTPLVSIMEPPTTPDKTKGPKTNPAPPTETDSDKDDLGALLRPVPIEAEEDLEPPKPKHQDQTFKRKLSKGTFVYDFNRVEHMAATAFHFPIPIEAVKEDAPPPEHYQRAALFLVRQNKAGVLFFTVRPEPEVKLDEEEIAFLKEEPALKEVEKMERLYIAGATGAILPCSMLLDSKGRMLEFTTKFGSGDVTYTLDDPIMHRRKSRARLLKGQAGPTLIRPPWH